MYLAPYTVSGINVCPMAELANCHKTCLFVQGRAQSYAAKKTFVSISGYEIPDSIIIHARIARTELFHTDREAFLIMLEKEINALIRKAKRLNFIPVVRLNGTSDIRWENIQFKSGDTIFARFPKLMFYDYTKINNRKNLPRNYHLSWSYSGASERYAAMRPNELNWVVVFSTNKFPKTFLGRKVIDGDETDLRFLDDSGIVVGLKAKGSARNDTSGFVVRI
jgi:hypothetical protein